MHTYNFGKFLPRATDRRLKNLVIGTQNLKYTPEVQLR